MTRNPSPAPTERKSALEPIPEDLGSLGAGQIARLARAYGLPTSGTKSEVIRRLTAARSGGVAGYVPGQTLCSICREPCKVTSTDRSRMADGRLLVTRYLRCTGRHHHTSVVREIRDIRPAAPPKGPQP